MNVSRHLRQAAMAAAATGGVLMMTAAYSHVVLPVNEHPWMERVMDELIHGARIAQYFFLGSDDLESPRFAEQTED